MQPVKKMRKEYFQYRPYFLQFLINIDEYNAGQEVSDFWINEFNRFKDVYETSMKDLKLIWRRSRIKKDPNTYLSARCLYKQTIKNFKGEHNSHSLTYRVFLRICEGLNYIRISTSRREKTKTIYVIIPDHLKQKEINEYK